MNLTAIARWLGGSAVVLAGWALAWAAEEASPPAAVKSPTSPQESLEHLVVQGGLRVELAACEPQVIDPVAIRFDEHGRMWVVEMRDYPTGPKRGEKPISRISLLEDRDGDGFFETAAVFADNLLFATGVQPWQGGVFVTLAGQVAYMKDTDGDGRADVRQAWYTGFTQGNSQLRANHPRLALDNRIYVANGLRSGTVSDAVRPGVEPLSISGMDFRFDPLTHEFDGASGMGQFGQTFDDFGNRFVCTNRNPAIHVVLDNRYLLQNPLVAVTSVLHDVARPAAESRVFPIARSWTTSNLHAGQFTAACGVEVYRGDALGPDYYGNLFVCEPTAHLVHRELMRPSGATFESTPAYEGVDFLASRDSWFSPVNLETGPDGALYVVDMYRAVIEHPDWVPEELQHRPDQMLGNDRGRIYRVTAKTVARQGPTRKFSTATNSELVGQLADPNAWRRETAARLLLERQDKGVAGQLRDVALRHESPVARIHALWLLEGLGVAQDDVLLQLMANRDPHIVEQAIAASYGRIADNDQLRAAVANLTDREEARVRFQSLLTARLFPKRVHTPEDEWERWALLIAAGSRGGEALSQWLRQSAPAAGDEQSQRLTADLAKLAAASKDDRQYALAVEALASGGDSQRPGLSAFLAEAARRGRDVSSVRSCLRPETQQALDQALAEASATAGDAKSPPARRCEAIELAALAGQSGELVARLAESEPSPEVRLKAIAALAGRGELEPWRRLLAGFSGEPPAIRTAIVDGVLARTDRTALLLDEFAAGRIKPAAIGAAQLDRLLTHGDASIKARAQQLAAAAAPADRQQALADYQQSLGMTGDARRGRLVFEKHCATCHRIGDVGVDVAPDISDSREKTPTQYLTDIIQPNRAIDANYFSYTCATVGGLVYTGILSAETATSITLKQAEGKAITVPRDEIEELRSSGMSLMPEGLEREISKQEMSDLIFFIKNWRYLDGKTPVGKAP